MKTLKVWTRNELAPVNKYDGPDISVSIEPGGVLVAKSATGGGVVLVGWSPSYWKLFELTGETEGGDA